MILPEDTTEVFNKGEGVDYNLAHNLPPCLGFIKGICWVFIAIIAPIILPILLRAIAEI